MPLTIRPAPSTVDVPPVAEADQLVSNVDLPATILDLAGATPCRNRGPCRTLDGRSLVPLMEGDASEWPGDRAIAIEGDVNASDPESGHLSVSSGAFRPRPAPTSSTSGSSIP